VRVARSGEEDTPVVPAPVALRPFINFAKLSSSAVAAARRAVDADEEFRARVAEDVSEDEVGRAGWLWLTRPHGWQDELDALASGAAEAGHAAEERRAENEARRRLEGAEAATRRAEAAAASAQAESARAVSALAEERRARRTATEQAEDLARRLDQVTGERDQARNERDRAREEGSRARRRVAAMAEELEELRNAPPPAPPEPAAPEPLEHGDAVAAEEVRRAGAALLQASAGAAGMAESLRQAAVALGAGPPPPPSAPAQAPPAPPAPPPARRPRPPRRIPVALPPGVLDDSVEAADHLFRVPGMTVLVDGYNASQLGWFDLPIAEQRRRLVDALTEMAMRSGADVVVIFDGAESAWPATVPKTSRLVKVNFSPADVEADDVILARVADIDPSRPVLVASSDRRVRDGAAAQGANVISSDQLLAVMRR
jgi:predicted RNA-binding protein with PIN domain